MKLERWNVGTLKSLNPKPLNFLTFKLSNPKLSIDLNSSRLYERETK